MGTDFVRTLDRGWRTRSAPDFKWHPTEYYLVPDGAKELDKFNWVYRVHHDGSVEIFELEDE